jgi:hypothetical protein
MQETESVSTYSFDLGAAFITCGSQVLLKAIFTIQFSLFLYKTNICQWATALGIDTYKMVWTPVLTQCSDERASGRHNFNYFGSTCCTKQRCRYCIISVSISDEKTEDCSI